MRVLVFTIAAILSVTDAFLPSDWEKKAAEAAAKAAAAAQNLKDKADRRCSVYMYEHNHFKGHMHEYHTATQHEVPTAYFQDEYSSIKVEGEAGCHVFVYEHPNFGGWSKRLDRGSYTERQLWDNHGVHNDAISSFKVVNLCHLWGCTCQGHSDKYLTDGGVGGGWGTVGQEAEVSIAAWWKDRDCKTSPACKPWSCTCQGLSNTYGTYPGNWGNAVGKAAEWWGAKGCATIPTNRCLATHCNGHWKLKSASWKILCTGGICQTNTSMCCKVSEWETVSMALGCPSSGCLVPSPSHGCESSCDHAGQCCWPSLMEAKARCGAWSECQAFWGPHKGKYYARGEGYTDHAWAGMTGYIKRNGRNGRRRIEQRLESLIGY